MNQRTLINTGFDGRHERGGGRLATSRVGEVGDGVSLVERSASRPRLRQQVAWVVKAEVSRALLASTWSSLALAAARHKHNRSFISSQMWQQQQQVAIATSCCSTDSEKPHRYCHLLYSVEFIACVRACRKCAKVPISTKIRLLKALVWPVATSGCESWTLGKNEETRFDAFEMKGLRKILRVSRTAKKTNEWVLHNTRVEGTVWHRQSKEASILWSHHEKRGEKGKETIQGTMPGARRRGRPHTAWMDSMQRSTVTVTWMSQNKSYHNHNDNSFLAITMKKQIIQC